jgi:O-acetyl-ADP-ribose deacetylase (regulator of RNase III)
MATEIKYIEGDATSPIGDGQKFILHCCNDLGLWGAGFVLAISRKWDNPEAFYRCWHDIKEEEYSDFELGSYQVVPVEPSMYVVNLIGQHGVGLENGPPVRYDALETGMKGLCMIKNTTPSMSIHMPRIGCGLAGGKWELVENTIKKTFCEAEIPVTVYDYNP